MDLPIKGHSVGKWLLTQILALSKTKLCFYRSLSKDIGIILFNMEKQLMVSKILIGGGTSRILWVGRSVIFGQQAFNNFVEPLGSIRD